VTQDHRAARHGVEHDGHDGQVDTRRRMIDTALELIADNGYAGMSLQMVATATGVTKAAVYYHFRTKAELLDAILQQLFAGARPPESNTSIRSRRARLTGAAERLLDALTHSRRALAVINGDPAIRRHTTFLALVEDVRKETIVAVYGENPTSEDLASFYLATSAVNTLPNLEHLTDTELVQALRPPVYRALGLRYPPPTRGRA
jgi:AcrR family transcriptional regulator